MHFTTTDNHIIFILTIIVLCICKKCYKEINHNIAQFYEIQQV